MISFKKKLYQFDQKINFTIANANLRPEFDNIKTWFTKKLNKKTFTVNAEIKISNGKVDEINTSSKEIELINPEMIDSIKYLSTIGVAKKSNNHEKTILNINEIFSEKQDDGSTGNVFIMTEEETLMILMRKGNIRNKKQLEYLSGVKQSAIQPMRYTLHPQFGFVFFVEGAKHNHFVWELLDSHATYLWSFIITGLDPMAQYQRMEMIINTIKNDGRETYKNAYRNSGRDADIIFNVIQHKDVSSAGETEFPYWKKKLDQMLI